MYELRRSNQENKAINLLLVRTQSKKKYLSFENICIQELSMIKEEKNIRNVTVSP